MVSDPKILFKELWKRKDGKTAVLLIVVGLIGGIAVSPFMANSKFLRFMAIVLMLLICIGTTKFSRIIYALSGVEQTQAAHNHSKKKKKKK